MQGADRVLIVDDNAEMLELLKTCLAPLPFDFTLSVSGHEALGLLQTGRFPVAILDLTLPDLNGIEILRCLRDQHPKVEVIVLTAYASLETAIEAVRLGAYDYVTKPFDTQVLRSALRRAVEKQRLSSRLTAVQDLSRVLTLALDVQQVAATVLDFCGRVLFFRDCGLWLIDEARAELLRLAARGTELKAAPRLPLESGEGITVTVARTGKPLYVPDLSLAPRHVTLNPESRTRSELATPLLVQERVIGVLDVESATANAFSLDDARLLFALAAQAGAAIERARLYEQAQLEIAERKQAEEALRYRVEFENLITAIATFFVNLRTEEIDAGVNDALRAIATFVGVDRGFMFHLSADGQELDQTHEWCAAGIEPLLVPAQRLPANPLSSCMRKLKWFETVHLPHVAGLDRETQAELAVWGLQRVRSIVLVPMAYSKTLIGFLGFGSERIEKTWSEQDIRLLKTVGEVLVAALSRKRTDEALRRAKETAEAANLAKNEFLARMSHEIRTPIHSISGLSDLLLSTELAPDQRELLDIISSSADSLLVLVNDLLDFARIEARHLELNTTEFDLRTVIYGTSAMMAQRAQEKGLRLTCDVAPDLPPTLVGDPGRLRQVLVNLLGNALKFTERGEIVLSVERVTRDTREAGLDPLISTPEPRALELHFAVRDTGIGIRADKRNMIFEAFWQGDGSTTREYGGTGLGLAICKELVELMEGHIWVESVPGAGSTFHFTVKLVQGGLDGLHHAGSAVQEPEVTHTHRRSMSLTGSDRTTSALASRQDQPSLNILLADDNAAGQLVGRRMLERMGHRVQVCKDGRETLRTAQNQAFDLLVIDVEMPEMDGLQVTRAIRESENKTGGHLPIIAMTAYARQDDRHECLRAGMDGYLAKPVNFQTLREAINHLALAPRTGGGQGPNTVSDHPRRALPVGGALRSEDLRPPGVAEVDVETALGVVGDDRELLQEVVALFLEQDYPRQLTDLKRGLEAADPQAVGRAAHGIKGALRSFGGVTAAEWALALERMGKTGQLSDARGVLHELEAAVKRFAAFYAPLHPGPVGAGEGWLKAGEQEPNRWTISQASS